jgi:hypothetical protein
MVQSPSSVGSASIAASSALRLSSDRIGGRPERAIRHGELRWPDRSLFCFEKLSVFERGDLALVV